MAQAPDKRNEEGFTLAEAIVSMGIMAVALITVLAVLPEGYRRVVISGRVSTMNHLALREIDQLKAKGVSSSELSSGSHPASASQYPVSGFPGYSLTWNVTDNTPISNIKTITVEVAYMLYDSSGSLLPSSTGGQMRSTFQMFVTL